MAALRPKPGSASPLPRDLVLGLVHGYPAAIARPFLDSLRRQAPHAEITLAVSLIDAATRDELRSRGCRLLPYHAPRLHFAGRTVWAGNTRWARFHTRYGAWINALPGLSPDTRLLWRARVVRHFLDPNTRRFVEFYLRLRHILDAYDRVLLSDLRDVVFQADPFALLQGEGIVYGLEDEAETIGSSWANSLWTTRVAGEDFCASIAHERISCVGAVLASGPVMRAYLHHLVDALTRPGINVAGFHGADTGAHNHVVRRGGLPGARFADFHTGGIINMHGLRPDHIRWNADGLLCDASGRAFALVHQYDRHPEVTTRLFTRLGLELVPHPRAKI